MKIISSAQRSKNSADRTCSTRIRGKFKMALAPDIAGLLLMVSVVCGQRNVTNINSTHPQTNDYGKRCGLPLVGPTVPDPQPERLLRGTWYKYRQSGSRSPLSVNQYLDFHPIGRTGLPLSTVQAEALWIQIPQYDAVNSTQCNTRFWTGLFGLDGKAHGRASQATSGFVPVQDNLNGMYFDYDKVYIVYGCNVPNYLSGMCDQPAIHVSARSRPDKMTQSELEYLDNLINQIFAPYCITVQDIPQQLFTDERPFCPIIPLPECVQKTITGLSIDVQSSVTR